MTTTPRTDAEARRIAYLAGERCFAEETFANFARTLETELAASREALKNVIADSNHMLAAKAAECERLREALVKIGTSPTVGPLAAADMANIANRALRGGA